MALTYNHISVLSACLWTTYRQCQLHLIGLQSRIGQQLNYDTTLNARGKIFKKLGREALDLIEETCASLPYLLMDQAILQSKPSGAFWAFDQSPALLGGLHLQWVLFTISIIEIVPENIRREMKGILLWIGENLGIGQATVLGLVSYMRL